MLDFEVAKLSNPTKEDFIHEFAWKKFKIKANYTVDLPMTVAKDTAYYLAQRVLMSRWLPFFGQEHEEVIDELLGKQKALEIIEDEEIPEFSVEEAPIFEEVKELESTPMNFTPAEETVEEAPAPKAKKK